MWSGASRSTPINDKTDRKKPSAWRKGNRKTRRSVNAVSIAQSENVFGAPGRPDGDGRHASVASAESHSVTSPRWTKACSYADQFPTRYFVLYFGWTFDLMSRSCTRSGHRGQRAYSCLALVRGCGQAYALQTVEPVTYRCGTRRVCQARSSGSERDTRARPHAVAPMNCVPEDSRRRSTCTGRTHSPRARADGNQTPSSTVAVRAPSPS